ncbi:MAG: hypothetical protein QXK65_01375, partial [Candidatus Micrarchaeaceae archaeon]
FRLSILSTSPSIYESATIENENNTAINPMLIAVLKPEARADGSELGVLQDVLAEYEVGTSRSKVKMGNRASRAMCRILKACKKRFISISYRWEVLKDKVHA